jgi:hypothetical protein
MQVREPLNEVVPFSQASHLFDGGVLPIHPEGQASNEEHT